jgi:hypothetical protein
MVEVLYISGSGRSGSTLLERVLNSSERFFAVGEFHALWRLPMPAITCSCGAKVPDDDFWCAVLGAAGVGAADLAELARLEAVVARSGYIAAAGYKLGTLAADPQVRAYLAPQFAIFDALATLTGKPIIVDSSKAGPRAWLMASDQRSRMLHLYRDPTDVIASWRSRKFDQGLGTEMARPGVVAASTDWWKAEYFARRLARQTIVGMVDYQALCADPKAVLDAALIAAGIAGASGIAWQGDHEVAPAPVYHSLNGNPDRFDRGVIAIASRRPDWSRYAPLDRLAIRAAGGALAGLYPPAR